MLVAAVVRFTQWQHMAVADAGIFGGQYVLPNAADGRFEAFALEAGLMTTTDDTAAQDQVVADLQDFNIYKTGHCASVFLEV